MDQDISAACLSRGTVLLAEDEAVVSTVLVEFLSDWGFHTYVVTNGTDAIAALHSRPRFDLVITDVCMPDVSGAEVFAAVRNRYADVPVLYITGLVSNAIETESSHDEYLGILEKPFGAEALREAIATLMF